MSRRKRVVITGVGIVSPCGAGRRAFWRSLREGTSGIGPLKGFGGLRPGCRKAGQVQDFDISRLLKMKGLRRLSRSAEFVLAASKLALNDAGISCPLGNGQADSYGVSLGISTGSIHSFIAFDKEILTEGPRFVDPLAFSNVSFNSLASQISIKFNIKGFNTTIAASSTSGLDAISYSCNMIKRYGYKAVLTGSVEELSYELIMGLERLKCLAGQKSKGARAVSCPYDKRRNGIIPGEGACIFLLEDLQHARRRKARAYAEVKGYGYSFDPDARRGFSIASTGAAGAMSSAISESGCSQTEISFIAGSANSSAGYDYTEARAIRKVFGEGAKYIPVTSVKSITGEAFSVSGSFSTAAALGAISGNFIPPTINYRFPDRRIGLSVVANKAKRQRIDDVLINAFGHNGHNSSLIVGRHQNKNMKNIFITGATGFLGSRLIKTLIERESCYIYMLIKPRRNFSAAQRRRLLINKLFQRSGRKQAARRIDVIAGDVSKGGLGINKRNMNMLGKAITDIYHCAAIPEFGYTISEIRKVNVFGTENLLKAALRWRREGPLKRVNHISTVYIAGDYKGRFYERQVDVSQAFNNTYEQSKFEAEQVVLKYRKRGLPIDIYRPSIITDDMPKLGQEISLLLRFLPSFILEIFDEIPSGHAATFNIIPVDVVCEAIYLISTTADRPFGENYHITNPASIRCATLIDMISKFFNVKKPRCVPPEKFQMDRLTPVQRRMLVRFMPYLNQRLVFDMKNSAAVLKKYNFKISRITKQAVINSFKYYRSFAAASNRRHYAAKR